MGDELPQRPTTHDADAWVTYRKEWQAYAAEWRNANSDAPYSGDAVPSWPAYYAAWQPHWAALNTPWRTEPEIDEERQHYLAERRAIIPDIERGIYPFRGERGSVKLTRADVEWLLATHESGGMQGPVDWGDGPQRKRDGLDLRGADLQRVDLSRLPLARVRVGLGSAGEWLNATVEQREAAGAQLIGAQLEYTNLEGAYLNSAHLEAARIGSAHLEGSRLRQAHLGGAHMEAAYFDTAANLSGVRFGHPKYGAVALSDVRWGGVNLATVNWAHVTFLGDEQEARQPLGQDGTSKDAPFRLVQYRQAVRANRQLSLELRNQGLNEEADRFAYRANVVQRTVLRRQKRIGRYAGSWFLNLVAGYGYRPSRSVAIYVLVVCCFAAAYWLLGTPAGHAPTWYEALVVSLTAFHGRGFFATQYAPGDPQSILAAAEAVVGLLIEITFIATFTQRVFAR